MSRTKRLRDVAVILGPLICVLNHQLYRRAGRLAVKHARQNPHLVRLFALGGEFAGARFALIQPRLQIGL